MARMNPLPLTAAVYCRVSTAGQEEDGTSLQSQEAACRAHAEALGYTVAAVYRDVHSGADLFGRPQMTELRQSMRRRDIGIIVAYALDRLSRKQVHQGLIYAEAEHAGVPIELVTEKLEDTPEGRLLLSVKGYAAEVEREKIRERSLRGKRTRIENGKLPNFGAELYGYRRDKAQGVRRIEPGEASIVVRVFASFANDGATVRGIARALNDEVVSTPSAGKRVYRDGRVCRWNPSTIQRILTEPAYMGKTIAWRRRARKDGRQWEYRDPSEWIELPEGTTPALVTPEMWNAAQTRLAATTAATTRNQTRPYLLRGLIYCAVCGLRMYAESEHGRPIYRCSSRDRAGAPCGGKRVPAEVAETWVWDEVEAILNEPTIIVEAVDELRQAGPDAALLMSRDTATRMAGKLDAQRNRLVRRYAEATDDGFPWDLVEREITRIERERRDALATVQELEQRISAQEGAVLRLDALQGYCDRVRRNLESADFTTRRDAVEALVRRVDANGRDFTLTVTIDPAQRTGVSTHSSSGARQNAVFPFNAISPSACV